MARVERPASPAVDLVVALALAAAAVVEVWAPDLAPGMGEVEGNRWFLTATCLTMTLPLAVRRRVPVTVLLAALGSAVLQQQVSTPTEGLSTLVALLVAAYSAAAYAGRRGAVAGGAVIALASWFTVPDAGDGLFVLILLGGAWTMGLAVGRGAVALGRVTADKQRLEAEQAEAAARGAAEERLRIARDLHDVVAHQVSMIVVQAQAADALLTSEPERARAALAAVEDSGRAALTELRSLLGLLREGHPDRSQPDLAAIDDLVSSSRTSGMSIELTRTGVERPVSPVIAMAAFRVVQEALTNVVKHAGNAPVRVSLEFGASRLTIEVEDDGPPIDGVTGAGFGLAGMTERVTFAGGQVSFAPRPDRGFRVRAELPVGEVAP